MKTYELQRTQRIDQDIATVFEFFADATNLERITPPWLRFEFAGAAPRSIRQGARIAYQLRWRWIPICWLTEIVEWQPTARFVDVQIKGPYRLWHHTHEFETRHGATVMRDLLRYALPFHFVGSVAHRLLVRRDIEAIFDYRAKRVDEIFAKE